MIGRAAIVERVAEWGLREDVVEKDYVLGWVLWSIGSDPVLSGAWAFKGGTCLKKCYVETTINPHSSSGTASTHLEAPGSWPARSALVSRSTAR